MCLTTTSAADLALVDDISQRILRDGIGITINSRYIDSSEADRRAGLVQGHPSSGVHGILLTAPPERLWRRDLPLENIRSVAQDGNAFTFVTMGNCAGGAQKYFFEIEGELRTSQDSHVYTIDPTSINAAFVLQSHIDKESMKSSGSIRSNKGSIDNISSAGEPQSRSSQTWFSSPSTFHKPNHPADPVIAGTPSDKPQNFSLFREDAGSRAKVNSSKSERSMLGHTSNDSNSKFGSWRSRLGSLHAESLLHQHSSLSLALGSQRGSSNDPTGAQQKRDMSTKSTSRSRKDKTNDGVHLHIDSVVGRPIDVDDWEGYATTVTIPDTVRSGPLESSIASPPASASASSRAAVISAVVAESIVAKTSHHHNFSPSHAAAHVPTHVTSIDPPTADEANPYVIDFNQVGPARYYNTEEPRHRSVTNGVVGGGARDIKDLLPSEQRPRENLHLPPPMKHNNTNTTMPAIASHVPLSSGMDPSAAWPADIRTVSLPMSSTPTLSVTHRPVETGSVMSTAHQTPPNNALPSPKSSSSRRVGMEVDLDPLLRHALQRKGRDQLFKSTQRAGEHIGSQAASPSSAPTPSSKSITSKPVAFEKIQSRESIDILHGAGVANQSSIATMGATGISMAAYREDESGRSAPVRGLGDSDLSMEAQIFVGGGEQTGKGRKKYEDTMQNGKRNHKGLFIPAEEGGAGSLPLAESLVSLSGAGA